MKVLRSGLTLLLCSVASAAFAETEMPASIRIGECDMGMTFSENFDHFIVQPSVHVDKGWTAHTPWAGKNAYPG